MTTQITWFKMWTCGVGLIRVGFGGQTWNSSESSPVEIVTGVRVWEISINVYFNDDSLFPVWVGLNQMPKYPLSLN